MESTEIIYIFDMDGTLTPPRLPMTEAFADFFLRWLKGHTAYIATGSDYAKVRQQLPQSVIDACDGVYCSMGNVLVVHGKTAYEKKFEPDPSLLDILEEFRRKTSYPHALFPNYIEKRAGMINFSVLGRDCPYAERERYNAWDKEHQERLSIQAELQRRFPQYDIAVGGSISMDITPKGCGKGQIARLLREAHPNALLHFVGDRTFPGGNDYELASALRNFPPSETIQVAGPEELLGILEQHTKK